MVEAKGVEPLSEITTTEASPSAAYSLNLAIQTPDKHGFLQASPICFPLGYATLPQEYPANLTP